jgi:hypothetical protein
MSNTRRAKWSQAEVTAATALDDFEAAVREAEAEAARTVVTRHLVAGLEARGHAPGLIARLEGELAALGDDYWAGLARESLFNGSSS